MTKTSIRNILITAIAALLCAFTLCSCGPISNMTNADNAQKTQTAIYYSTLYQITNDLKAELGDFNTLVKNKDTNAMKEKLNNSQKLIDQLKDIDVPQGCEEVQQNYLDAFVQMQEALSNYINVYTDFINGSIDNSVLNTRVADIQKSYTQGLDLLVKADSLAAQH